MKGNVLAQLLQQQFSKTKTNLNTVNLENSKITKIGTVPQQFANKIYTLNLGHNALRSLEGIHQFTYLESLDLSNNKIFQGSIIMQLRNLEYLRKIYIKGNPFLDYPLTEDIINFLGSFENDLQILNYGYRHQNRQSLVSESQHSHTQSMLIQTNQSKPISQKQPQEFFNIRDTPKSVNKSKVQVLLGKMQEFIEQKHQSQEVSSQSIENLTVTNKQLTFENENTTKDYTLETKSPKFASNYKSSENNIKNMSYSSKFQEESTNLKAKYMKTSKLQSNQSPHNTNKSTQQNIVQDRFLWENSLKNQSSSFNDFNRSRKSPQKQFKYQVSNLKINMETDNVALNYPSITQKQDQDSYEIQFDFMSPKKLTQSKRNDTVSECSPFHQLKQITEQYVKIQEDNISELERNREQIIENPAPVEYPLIKNSQKLKTKENHPQIQIGKSQLSQKQYPILSKKGSLYESTRSFVPQPNTSTAYTIINKLFGKNSTENQGNHSSRVLFPDIIQNTQKFEKFYYNSLTRLKPAFNLLYSPFHSLKTDEKDLLLQELFKNHKQIFILFIREFYSREKLQEQLQSTQKQNFQLNSQIQKLKQELLRVNNKVVLQQNNLQKLTSQNCHLKKQSSKFNDILASRQKIITDVRIQYQKVNRIAAKRQLMIEKMMAQDDIQDEITEKHDARLKKIYLKILHKKAQNLKKIQLFEQKRQIRSKRQTQKRNHELKSIAFTKFTKNLNYQRSIKKFIEKKNKQIIQLWFNQWKKQAQVNLLSKIVQSKLDYRKKAECLKILNRNNLKNKRNKRVQAVIQIKLKRKAYNSFVVLSKEAKQKNKIFTKLSVEFNKKTILSKHFSLFKHNIEIQHETETEKCMNIQKRIAFHNLLVLNRIVYLQKKEETKKQHSLQVYLNHQKRLRALNKLKKYFSFKREHNQKLSTAEAFRFGKVFYALKRLVRSNQFKNIKLQKITRKLAHNYRLHQLMIEFRSSQVFQLLKKRKVSSFYDNLKQICQQKQLLLKKITELQSFLNFRRGFKAKHNFFSSLRHLALSKKLKKKEENLQQHYEMRQDKYKQSHSLNIVTIEQFKSQIDSYLNQIEFYKIQVQKLSQRQLLILQEKQNCLLEAKFKEEQNYELKRILVQNEEKLQQLERKYQKSLTMYAAAMEQISLKQTKIYDQTANSFLYDTVTNKSPATFRKQARQTNFTSLKR